MINDKPLKRSSNHFTAIEALSEAQKLIFAPLAFQATASLLDFGIIKFLDNNPANIATISNKLSLNEYIVKTLLQVATVNNIVRVDNDIYYLTKKGSMFLYDEMTISNFNFVKDVCYLGASELTKSFLEKKPCGLHKFVGEYPTIYPALSILPDKMKESWFNFDHLYSDNCFDIVLDIITKQYNKIFDIGANTGKFERLCIKQKPNCKNNILDLDENINVIKNDAELKGCSFYPIDVLAKNPKYPNMSNSAILLSQFLDCFSKEQILKILNDIMANIDEKSTIYILEPFTDNQYFQAAKLSLVHISLYFTCMANGVSKMYEQKEFEQIIKDAGLAVKKIHNNIGSFDYTLMECVKL